jgi:hypothetical protein
MDKKTLQAGDIVAFKSIYSGAGIDAKHTHIGQIFPNTSGSKIKEYEFILSGSSWFPIHSSIEKVIKYFKMGKGKLLYIYRPSSNMELGLFLRKGIDNIESLHFFEDKERFNSPNLIYSHNKDKKEITISEIETILGYPIKIVDQK